MNQATFTVNVVSDTEVDADLIQGNTITADVLTGGQGPAGETGPQGSPGPAGPTGPGVPVGGLQGQYLVKLSNSDYETYWATQQFYRGEDFDVVGDGVVDDTVAIQTMLDAARDNGGGICTVRSGIFNISDTLVIDTSVYLQGISPEASIIWQQDPDKDAITAEDGSSINLLDIQFRGQGSGTGKGISFAWNLAGNNPYHTIKNVIVREFGDDGLYLQTPIVGHLEKVVSWDNGGNGFNWYHAGTSMTFTSCWARGNAKAGYRFFESVYQSLTGCAADNNGINYEIVDSQSIGFFACGSEGALVNNATYNGYGWKISNSSEISLDACWVTDNRNIGVWVTDNSQAIALRVADNTPNGTATNFIVTDSGTNGSIYELHNTTANSIAGNWNTYNDGAGGTRTKDIYIENATATTVPYLNANKAIVSSAVTPTELGHLSGVTSAVQTQLNAKQSTDATLTALAAYNTNGILTQTAADTFTGRTITGTANQVAVTNGDGVSGNPTLALPQNIHTGASPQFTNLRLTGAQITDANGNTSINITSTTSAVNYLDVVNSATGQEISLRAAGSDTNVSWTIRPKGTSGITKIQDNSGNNIAQFLRAATAVNRFDFTNAATGAPPILAVDGTDTNIDMAIRPKGNGTVRIQDGGFVDIMRFQRTASAVNQVSINNAATGGTPIFQAIGSDTNVHIQVAGKGNGLLKHSVLRQDNTTDSYKHNSVMLTGWGVFTAGAAPNKSETVTFGITFAQRPIVTISYGGDDSAGGTAYGDGGNEDKGPVAIKAHTVTTTGFTAHAHTSDGTSWAAGTTVFYQWIAVGEL